MSGGVWGVCYTHDDPDVGDYCVCVNNHAKCQYFWSFQTRMRVIRGKRRSQNRENPDLQHGIDVEPIYAQLYYSIQTVQDFSCPV